MGLRINTNLASIITLRNLNEADNQQQKSLERLSTGLKINHAGDDPSGLVISEQLRAQISGLGQAVENSQFASNLAGTAEAALGEISDLLAAMRQSAVFSLNSGATSREQVAAEQDSVDSAIAAIERIANTTRFATTQLLNGESAFHVTSQDAGLLDVAPISLAFDPASDPTTYTINVTTPGKQASMLASGTTSDIVVSGGPVVLRITGSVGSEDIVLASGTDLAAFSQSINMMRGNTGVYASGSYLYSDSFGSTARITIEQMGGSGTFNGAGGAITKIGDSASASGADAVASINGAEFSADGNVLNITTPAFAGRVELAPNSVASGTSLQFTVERSGLLFQLNSQQTSGDQHIIGLPNMSPAFLGMQAVTVGGQTVGGFLDSLKAGGDNDMFTNPGNALKIIDAALGDVSNVRAYLGSFVSDTVGPNIDSLNVAIENLTASDSQIRDLDFASETAEFARSQVLFQAGISVLSQANIIPQAVLKLLQ